MQKRKLRLKSKGSLMNKLPRKKDYVLKSRKQKKSVYALRKKIVLQKNRKKRPRDKELLKKLQNRKDYALPKRRHKQNNKGLRLKKRRRSVYALRKKIALQKNRKRKPKDKELLKKLSRNSRD